jgi:23S rRNA (uracil-5-)-methyltransferase RumA
VDRQIRCARSFVAGLKTPLEWLEIVGDEEAERAVFVGKAGTSFSAGDEAVCAGLLGAKDIQGVVLFGRGWRRTWGEVRMLIRLGENIPAQVDADVFTQVNRAANLRLVSEVLEWGDFNTADRVLELYCGAGNFTLPLAGRCAKVVAVEGNARSIKNGKASSRLNGYENIRWICSDVARAMKSLPAGTTEQFSKILLNPPRSGAKGLAEDLAAFSAEKILYVSCDPSTLARDLSALVKTGYSVGRIQPFDLFPHTFHVETLAELVK